MEAAVARGRDVVVVDTAGRLHTQTNLMEELAKVRRVIAGRLEGAPHETLLVVDATTGQNGVQQARLFGEAVGVTGVVLTKLDGSAKGGVAIPIAYELGLPVKLVGVGEALEDLQPFDPRDYARALVAGASPGTLPPMFDALSEKLQSALGDLRGRGVLDEEAISRAMREVRLALLEADVNFGVVKEFVAHVRERALGEDVRKSLTPGQQVVKIVHEELTELLGSADSRLAFSPRPPTTILLAGLQGSGKTTAAGKLALLLKKEGRKPALVAADLQRPAAIDQLDPARRAGRRPGLRRRARRPGQGRPRRHRAREGRRARRRDPRHRRPPPRRRGADGGARSGARARRSRRTSCSSSTR